MNTLTINYTGPCCSFRNSPGAWRLVRPCAPAAPSPASAVIEIRKSLSREKTTINASQLV